MIKYFVSAVNSLFGGILSLLPDSPFLTFCVFVDEYDILGILNWIIPFDIFADILGTWLLCVSAYYIFLWSKGLLSGSSSVFGRFLDSLF